MSTVASILSKLSCLCTLWRGKDIQRASKNKVNHDLTVTLDLRGMAAPAALELIETATGYGAEKVAIYGIDVTALGEQAHYFPSLEILDIDPSAEGEPGVSSSTQLRDTRGKITSAQTFDMREVRDLANSIGVDQETIRIVDAHMMQGYNYLVSDAENVHKTTQVLFRSRAHHAITPDELVSTLHRLQRCRGNYYLGPRQLITPRSFYYREIMLQRAPAYQPMWSTAVFGIDAAGLDPDFGPFAGSLDSRITHLLQIADDMDQQAHEAADNGSRWEMVNHLQYFAMLATGLFDNIAWLTAIRYGFYRKYMDDETKRNAVALRIRKGPNGQLMLNGSNIKRCCTESLIG